MKLKPKKRLKFLIILFIQLAVVFLALEGFIRFYIKINPEFRKVFEKPFLYSMEKLHPYFGFMSDKANNIDNKLIKRKKKEYIIVILGGSTAWGEGGEKDRRGDDSAITKTLENQLNKKHNKKIKVYNCAHPGYHTTQEKNVLSQLIFNNSEIDMVINIDGKNNLARPLDNYVFNLPLNYPGNPWPLFNLQEPGKRGKYYLGMFFLEMRDNFFISEKSKLIFWLSDYFGKSLLSEYILSEVSLRLINNIKKLPEEEILNVFNNAVEFYLKDVLEIRAIAGIQNIKSIFILQPIVGYSKQNLSDIEKSIISNIGNDYGLTYEFWVKGQEKMRQQGKNLIKSGVIFYDFSSVFSDISDAAHVDLEHMNALGQKIFAERLAEKILPHID